MKVEEAGIFLYFIFPGAYVSLDEEALTKKSAWDRLTIICSGAWHNAILCIVSYLILINLPTLVSWGYYHSSKYGLMVLKTGPGIPNYKGYLLTHLNDHSIENGLDRMQLIIKALSNTTLAGPFRCTTYHKYPACCQSSNIKENSLDCLWDLKSLETYTSLTQLSNISTMNVIPKFCQHFALGYLQNKVCKTALDCHDQICMGPFGNGNQKIVHLRFRNRFRPEIQQTLTFKGRPTDIGASSILGPK